ncbi:hypothetical protein D082_29360 [Synechocystis sp. PCC 6714]|nr:hypothetical protein D082_29360 [Synechocystis sp. PCC 6714]
MYDKSRRLLFVLDPSHAWLFLLGCGVGLLLSLTWINLAHKSSPVDNAPTQGAPSWQVD